MDSGKVLCLTACGQVYPTLSEISHSVQGTGSNNHFNTTEGQFKRKQHKYFVPFYALSENQPEVAAYHKQCVIRYLLYPSFAGNTWNHGKNLWWKVQKERQFFALLLVQIWNQQGLTYECSLCLPLCSVLVTISRHLNWLAAWHLPTPHYVTDSLNFIKTFHSNQIICFSVQFVSTFLLKLFNGQFIFVSLFLPIFCILQTNTLSYGWTMSPNSAGLPETKLYLLSSGDFKKGHQYCLGS